MSNIRNFCILAHIDHGKSTLADRLLEYTGTVDKRQLKPQYLDRLESERERGITIKMAPVRMIYKDFILNLIDTPGHSDFSYEVSRALEAVEGAILLVDAGQGIQAQTLANFQSAKKAGLTVIGAISKIDLNPPDLDETVNSLAQLLNQEPEDILKVSGKTGEGVNVLLDKVVDIVPAPQKGADSGQQALIFDSLYDEHKGVIAFVRVFKGAFRAEEKITLAATKESFKIKEAGFFHPELKKAKEIQEGEIGYIATGLKDPDKINIGDTVGAPALPGYQEPQPVVFVSFYPEDTSEYEDLRQALAKLRLNDASLTFQPEKSELLGRGFMGGFLGQLHFEIITERLQKEFGISTIQSFPSVAYQVKTTKEELNINNPKDFPEDHLEAREPITEVEIITPSQYLGAVLSLKQLFRFSDFSTENINDRVLVKAKLPLADLISDLDDKLKSVSQGYASLSYKIIGFEKSDLKKMEVLVAGHVIPGLTRILPKEKVDQEARLTVKKLKELLPRQQFQQAIQTSVNGRVVARENISALKKDVTGYLYGGDRTRKMKLWKKQQKGKAKLKERAGQGEINIPPSVFRELMKK